MSKDKSFFLEEEMIIVRQSGEIPEVALHGSLHYLMEDPEGPGIEMSGEDRLLLAGEALKRYREIILRDLDPENRDATIYRGLARCIANWERCRKFCQSEKLEYGSIQAETAEALARFIHQEMVDVRGGHRACCLNCSVEMVAKFAEELGLSPAELPPEWKEVCGP